MRFPWIQAEYPCNPRSHGLIYTNQFSLPLTPFVRGEFHELQIHYLRKNWQNRADLKNSKGRSIEDYRSYLESLQEASRKIIRFEKPTIAAINGYALGSGYELALACDIRIAAKEALIGSPEARVTSSVTGGAFRLVQDLVGPGKARELLFTAENITGEEAERIGLVNCAVPLDKLMDEAMGMAKKIVENSSFSLKLIKKGFLMAQGECSLEALMDYEIEACLACVSTKEREHSLDDFEQRKK